MIVLSDARTAKSSLTVGKSLPPMHAPPPESRMPKPARASGHHRARPAASERETAAEPVLIELSQAQVDQVVHAASGMGNMAMLLSGLDDIRQTLEAASEEWENPRMSRSLLSGLLVLASFPADGSSLRVIDVAHMLEMSPSNTHRYFKTLSAVALIESDPVTRRYRLALKPADEAPATDASDNVVDEDA